MSLRGAVLTVPLSRTPRAPPQNAPNTGRATPRETPREAGSRAAAGGGGAADMQSGSGFRPFALVSPSMGALLSPLSLGRRTPTTQSRQPPRDTPTLMSNATPSMTPSTDLVLPDASASVSPLAGGEGDGEASQNRWKRDRRGRKSGLFAMPRANYLPSMPLLMMLPSQVMRHLCD